ncbi:hypothetical protein [Pseudomonas tolaasii]|uniref:hypothetical protein n=1 Tax=Pseudomonas tolaasii TaxID=29442 RepID=UPI00035F3C77|nr:hypothetical protein [Pseudomonas tolaasii]
MTTVASLFQNLVAITALVYAYFAFDVHPDPRRWHWGAWLVLAFWYVVLVSVYLGKSSKAQSDGQN